MNDFLIKESIRIAHVVAKRGDIALLSDVVDVESGSEWVSQDHLSQQLAVLQRDQPVSVVDG